MINHLRIVAICALAIGLMAVASGAGRVTDASPAGPSDDTTTSSPWRQSTVTPLAPDVTVPATPAVIPVRIKGFLYLPDPVTVPAGSRVSWTNEDNAPHTSTGIGDAIAALDSGAIVFGQTFTQQFNTPGTFPYFCVYHPNMLGTVVVTQ